MEAFLNGLNPGVAAALSAACATLFGALAAGWLFSRFAARASYNHPLVALAANFAVGLNLLALAYLALDSFGLLTPVTAWALPAAAVLAACFHTARARSAAAFLRDFKTLAGTHRWFFVFAAIFSLAALGSALCLPFGWDELTYHVEVPMRWVGSGTLAVFSDNPYSGFPSLVEVLSANGIAMGGVLVPRLVNLAVCAFLLFSFWLLLRRYANRSTAILGAAVLAASPLFLALSREAYVEPFIALDFTVAILVVNHARSNGGDPADNLPLILVVGVLTGGAAAMKLSGAVISLMVFGIWFWIASCRRTSRGWSPAASIVSSMAVAAVFAAPFYLRPWIQTGNPFHPYFAEWFTNDPAALRVSSYHHLLAERFGTHGLAGLLASPVALAFRSDLYDAIVAGWQLPVCAVVFLMIWARRLLKGRSDAKRVAWMPLAFAAFLITWYISAQQSRFVLPLLIIAILAGCQASLRASGRVSRFAALLIICAAAAASIDPSLVKHYYYGWKRHFLPNLTEEEYLKKALRSDGYVEAMKALTAATAESARIAMVFERRGLYCPRGHVIATPCFQEGFLTSLPNGPKPLLEKLRSYDIDFLLFGGSPANPDHAPSDSENAEKLAALLAELVANGKIKLVWGGGGYVLFKLRRKERNDSGVSRP